MTNPTNGAPHDVDDAIAIVGLAGRFPRADTLESFWSNLANGVDCVTEWPHDELLAAGYDPNLLRDPDFVSAKAVLADAESFDAGFFGYHPVDVKVIDPQQRVFLEICWQALEHAGYDPERYRGLIGVFAGTSRTSWAELVLRDRRLTESAGEYPIRLGAGTDFLTTRVSYKLNLKGPSFDVQTACSTSLVAVCVACQALQSYQCEMALAGGAAIPYPRVSGRLAHDGGIYSPRARCHAFDDSADGIVDGEGAGVVVLKRLSDAVADGDTVHALIRGFGLNNDGSVKVGFTAPSIEGQAQAIRMAQAMAGVSPDTISYVETHGTGTKLGDPIEVAGLTAAFQSGTTRTQYCPIGSVKTNIGHLDTAAGIAGLIKTVLSLEHRAIPPSLHFARPNSEIGFERTPFFVNTVLRPWLPQLGHPRRAGVSSFGLGGTNAHLVLEEAPAAPKRSASDVGSELLILSARSARALDAATSKLAAHLDTLEDGVSIGDVAFTLAVGRRAFEHRRAFICGMNRDGRSTQLPPELAESAAGVAREQRSVVFMFPGDGAQYAQMGAGLLNRFPVFAREIDGCLARLPQELRERVRPFLQTGQRADGLDLPSVEFPALFIVEYALARLWMSWGLTPTSLIGQGLGEYTAACVAGVMSLGDALSLVSLHGRLRERLGDGYMMTGALAEPGLRPLLDDELGSAAVDELRDFVSGLDLQTPAIPVISSLTGTFAGTGELQTVDYWVRHPRGTVRFAQRLDALLGADDTVFLEVGPGQVLSTCARQHLSRRQNPILASLKDPHDIVDDQVFLLSTIGKLWAAGVRLEWEKFYGEGRRRVPLPTYPFERSPYMPASATALKLESSEPRPAPIGSEKWQAESRAHGHVALEEVPRGHGSATDQVAEVPEWHLLPLSATSASALATMRENLAAQLRDSGASLSDVAFGLQAGCEELPWRSVAVASGVAEAAAVLAGRRTVGLVTSSEAAKDRSVVFMFPGGGAQYAGAGRQLYEGLATFRARVDASCRRLDPMVGAAIKRLICLTPPTTTTADRELAERPSIGLPLLFVVEQALAEEWLRFGVRPQALIGHSLGEYMAACMAGVLSVESALDLVQLRGRLFDKLPAGAMLSVAAPADTLAQYLSAGLDVAVVNGPASCVVSGPVERIEGLERRLSDAGFEIVRLHISVAAHSSMVEPLLPEFRALLERTTLRAPSIPMISNVTGDWLTAQDATSPEYWVRHLRQTVRFSPGLERLFGLSQPTLLEVGPGRSLSTLARQHPARPDHVVAVESMRHPQDARDDRQVFLSAAGRLWASGVPVAWGACREGQPSPGFERVASSGERQPSCAAIPKSKEDRVMNINLPSGSTAPVTTIPVAPANTPPRAVERREEIGAKLRQILQDLSGIDSATLQSDATFVELGFDSLSLTQVSQRVLRELGIRIKFRELLEAIPTVTALAAHIDRQLPLEPKAAAPQLVAPPTASSVAPISTMDSVAPFSLPGLSGAPSDFVQQVIAQQLGLMAQQLTVLQATGHNVPAAAGVASTAEPSRVADLAASAPPPATTPRPATRFGPYIPPDKRSQTLSDRQQRRLTELIDRYSRRTQGSKSLTEQYRQTLADPRAITGFRPQWKEMIYQLAMERSAGSRMWDVDGNEYVDFTMNFGVCLFGHSPSFVVEAVEQQLRRGLDIGTLSPLAGPASRLLTELAGVERMAFANTGSDAIMGALRAARTVTGQDRVLMFNGGYHGMNDELLVRRQVINGRARFTPAVPGVPQSAVDSMIVLDYDDPDCLEVVKANLPSLAAVIVEPIQSRRPSHQPRELLHALRQLTRDAGVALIFDELITGFRLHPAGAQGWYEVDADLVTYGKVISGGVPIAAIAGRSQFMDAFDGGRWRFGDASQPEANVTFYGGTYTRHPLGLAAATAVLTRLKAEGPELQARLNARTSALVSRLNAILVQRRVPVRVEHSGSIFLLRFLVEQGSRRTPDVLDTPPGTLDRLLYFYLRDKGIHLWDRPGFVSTAHTDEDFDRFVSAMSESVDEMLDAGFIEPTAEPMPHGTAAGAPTPVATLASPGITATPVDRFPLSHGQREIWLASWANQGGSLAFTQCVAVRLRGPLDRPAFQRALEMFVVRHQAFRIGIEPSGETQRVHAHLNVNLPFVDLSGRSGSDAAARIDELVNQESVAPFDLTSAPLFRCHLVRLSPTEHVFLFTAHHIICDGWSLTALLEELGPLYRQARGGGNHDLTEPMAFSEWVNQVLTSDHSEDERYWLNQFAQPVEPLELPTDRPRPPMKTYGAGAAMATLDARQFDQVRQAAARSGTTVFVSALTAYGLLMQRLTGQSDVVIGCAAAGQNSVEDRTLVGHCVSLLPVRLQLDPVRSIKEVVSHVRRQVLDAFDHDKYTYGQLLGKLHLKRDPSRLPLLSTLITYEVESPDVAFDDLSVQFEPRPRKFCNFDLELHVRAARDGLLVCLYFNETLFDRSTVERWTDYYLRLLQQLGEDPDRRSGTLQMMPGAEFAMVTGARGEQGAIEDVGHGSAYDLIATQVSRTPQSVAVSDAHGSLTYRELDEKAGRLAALLSSRGIGPGQIVAISMTRSRAAIAALAGVLRSGAAYLPLDPETPNLRLEFILGDAAPALVLVDREPQTAAIPALHVDDWFVGGTPTPAPPPVQVRPDDTAYVIYTSGSTGQPKGVRLPVQALMNFFDAMIERPGMDATDVVLALTTLAFDIAVLEVLLPLTRGARIVVAQPAESTDGRALIQLIARERVTLMQATPTSWRMLLEAGWQGTPSLRMITGGEPLTRELADALLERGAELWNGYGPSETTIYSTMNRVTRQQPISIGGPIANTQLLVLDPQGSPVPIGVRGELYIGGMGVGLGYVNRPELTAERFVSHPLASMGEKLYRTGDMVRYRPDGSLEFLGRADNQIKLRGYRIELGEIEEVLLQHPDVGAAVVLHHGGADPRLVAYLVAKSSAAGTDEIREYLSARLPRYMVPTRFVTLDAIPVLTSGKVDRQALAAIQPSTAAARAADRPLTPLEQQLARIWSELLKVDHLGADSDFFDLGGHSLIAMRFVTKVHEQFEKQLPLGALFEHRTIAQVARLIEGDVPAVVPTPRSTLVTLRASTSSRPPLLLVHAIGGEVWSYSDLAAALPSDRPVYGIQADSWNRDEFDSLTVPGMAAKYIQAVRSVQPTGPYYLGGFCAGSVIAYEMASQLTRDGEDVGLLAIIDHIPDDDVTVTGALSRISSFLGNLPLWLMDDLIRLDGTQIRRRIASRARLAWAQVRGRAADVRDELGMWRLPDHQVPFIQACLHAVRSHRTRPYAGKIVLLRARSFPSLGPWPISDDFGWDQIAGQQVSVVVLPGSHGTLIAPPFVAGLAASLDTLLAQDAKVHQPSTPAAAKAVPAHPLA